MVTYNIICVRQYERGVRRRAHATLLQRTLRASHLDAECSAYGFKLIVEVSTERNVFVLMADLR